MNPAATTPFSDGLDVWGALRASRDVLAEGLGCRADELREGAVRRPPTFGYRSHVGVQPRPVYVHGGTEGSPATSVVLVQYKLLSGDKNSSHYYFRDNDDRLKDQVKRLASYAGPVPLTMGVEDD